MCDKPGKGQKRVYVYWVEMQKSHRIVLSFDSAFKIRVDNTGRVANTHYAGGPKDNKCYYLPERIADFMPAGVSE